MNIFFKAVIIGKRRGKVLFLAVRNKFCAICARATTKQEEPKAHTCFRNWDGSSSAMEADIIVQGFCVAEEMYKLRYKCFIGDGDSSVYAKIVCKVPYGRQVKKVECVNHVIKNYGKNLHSIKNDTKVNIQVRQQLTQKKIHDLQKVAQSAIYNSCFHKNIEELREDLRNSPLHVFGIHNNCKQYYCEESNKSSDTSLLQEITETGLKNYLYGKQWPESAVPINVCLILQEL